MKREIKFRGKTEYDTWAYGDLFHRKTTVKSISSVMVDNIAVIEDTIGQFTGTRDKNNKEIYEGDILKDSTGRCRFVVFWNGCWWLKYKGTLFDQLVDQCRHSEIVGNIHDTGSKKL